MPSEGTHLFDLSLRADAPPETAFSGVVPMHLVNPCFNVEEVKKLLGVSVEPLLEEQHVAPGFSGSGQISP